MRHLGLVLVLWAVGLAYVPDSVQAFEIQGEDAKLPQTPAEFHGLGKDLPQPDFNGSSLAMPFSGDGDGGQISDYGNSIPIPGPGIDAPAPAWSYRPSFR
ncbi:MAG: hypothetical protein ACREDO_00810 [Methyloceanibacter sp.]